MPRVRSLIPFSFVLLPTDFLDEYLKEITAADLKIYLALLRFSERGESPSPDALASYTGESVQTVVAALLYFEDRGLIRTAYRSSAPEEIILLPPRRKELFSDEEDPGNEEEASLPKDMSLDPVDLENGKILPPDSSRMEEKRRLDDDSDFKELIFATEALLRKSLTPDFLDTLKDWYLDLNRNFDLTSYLIEYCLSKMNGGTLRIPYISAVLKAWKEAGYKSREEAIQSTKDRFSLQNLVRSAIGWRGDFASHQQALIESWAEFRFPPELIQEACRRTIDNSGGKNLNYTDSILRSWYESGVRSMEDVEAIDKKRKTDYAAKGRNAVPSKKSSFHNFEPNETNYDEVLRRKTEMED